MEDSNQVAWKLRLILNFPGPQSRYYCFLNDEALNFLLGYLNLFINKLSAYINLAQCCLLTADLTSTRFVWEYYKGKNKFIAGFESGTLVQEAEAVPLHHFHNFILFSVVALLFIVPGLVHVAAYLGK